ncbi:MAG: LAGLIDADG family homing endonuclease, partial [Gammaproteobacteria bacterium]
MATYLTPNKLKPTEAAYIAGLIDGEGTVTLSRKHRNDNRQLAISISNTEKALLDYVLQVVGAGKITNKRITRPQHTPSFTYA